MNETDTPWTEPDGSHSAAAPDRTDPATASFVRHRNLLFTVAYEMLGSATDAEDVLQETWLQWSTVDLDGVRDPRAYLVRIATRKALDRMRTLSRRKESYVGPWLPEPLLTSSDVADDLELADNVSMALLLVLESLSPVERAVFVLREVFDVPHDEIAAAVGKTAVATRQIARRARAHVAARRPHSTVTPAETRAALDAFRRAVETGDIQGLLNVVAPDVVLLTDGGGAVHAALNPISGAEPVVKFLRGTIRKLGPAMEVGGIQINGHPGLVVRLNGEVDTVIAARLDGDLISGLYAVRNPAKLTSIHSERTVTR